VQNGIEEPSKAKTSIFPDAADGEILYELNKNPHCLFGDSLRWLNAGVYATL